MDFVTYGKQVTYQVESANSPLATVDKMFIINILRIILGFERSVSGGPKVPNFFHQMAIYSPHPSLARDHLPDIVIEVPLAYFQGSSSLEHPKGKRAGFLSV